MCWVALMYLAILPSPDPHVEHSRRILVLFLTYSLIRNSSIRLLDISFVPISNTFLQTGFTTDGFLNSSFQIKVNYAARPEGIAAFPCLLLRHQSSGYAEDEQLQGRKCVSSRQSDKERRKRYRNLL